MKQEISIQAPKRPRSQLGVSAIKLIISLGFLVVLIHSAFVFIPLYIAQYDFDSQMDREANFGSVKKNAAIHKALLIYAKDRKIPLGKKNLKVVRTSARLTITANYTLPIATLFGTYDWEIRSEATGILF
jgi:hypothetical protein